MISAAPNYRRTYAEHWSGDASFVAPPKPLDETADAEQIKFHKAATADYEAKARVCFDTGTWDGLRVPGSPEPTTFTVRPLPTAIVATLADKQRGGLGDNQLYLLAFRAALVSVQNLGDAKVTFTDDPELGRIASLDFLAEAGVNGMLGVQIAREIGARCLWRATQLPFASGSGS
jgi:hypothetical protein